MNAIGTWYPGGPYEYTRAEDFIIDFRTDSEVCAALLPPVLEPDPDARAWLRVSRHANSSFGPYIGAYIGLYAVDRGESVRYILTGLKTDFMGVAAAREVWGFPYGLGSVTMQWQGNALSVAISGAAGEQHAQVYLQTLRRASDSPPGVGARYSARRPTFTGADSPNLLLRAQNAYDLGDADVWEARASLQLMQGTALDDWSVVPVREVLRSEYRRGGRSSLAHAEVVAQW